MTTITHNELACDISALARFAVDLPGKASGAVGFVKWLRDLSFICDQSVRLCSETRVCLEKCQIATTEDGCVSWTLESARSLARTLRRISLGTFFLFPGLKRQVSAAAEAWENLAEDMAMIRNEESRELLDQITQALAQRGDRDPEWRQLDYLQ